MSISSISASTKAYQAYQTSGQNNLKQLRQDFQDLARALQSGDLTGAQQAFAAVQQLLPNSSAGNQTQNGQQGSNQNPFATDLNALAQALQSGKLSDAQEAFAKLQQDMQAVQGHHHHRHHHNGSASTQSTAPTTSTSNPGAGSSAGDGGYADNAGSGSGSINITT